MGNQFSSLEARNSDPELQWRKLAGRDLQLWSIAFLVMLVMLTGLLSQFAPVILQKHGLLWLGAGYGPALALGLIALVLLLNFYLIGQRRTLDLMRYDVIREMVARQSLQQAAMIDPETQFFGRGVVTKVISGDVSRANRFGSDLTFVMLEADNYEQIRTSQNPFISDRMIVEMAKIVRQTFRGSDTVFRYSQSEFLVVMPDTSEIQATPALRRLLANFEDWNLNTNECFELSASFGISSYRPGEPLDPALRAPELTKTPLLSLRPLPLMSVANVDLAAGELGDVLPASHFSFSGKRIHREEGDSAPFTTVAP